MCKEFALWEMIVNNHEGSLQRAILRNRLSPSHDKWDTWVKYAKGCGYGNPNRIAYDSWRSMLVEQEII